MVETQRPLTATQFEHLNRGKKCYQVKLSADYQTQNSKRPIPMKLVPNLLCILTWYLPRVVSSTFPLALVTWSGRWSDPDSVTVSAVLDKSGSGNYKRVIITECMGVTIFYIVVTHKLLGAKTPSSRYQVDNFLRWNLSLLWSCLTLFRCHFANAVEEYGTEIGWYWKPHFPYPA